MGSAINILIAKDTAMMCTKLQFEILLIFCLLCSHATVNIYLFLHWAAIHSPVKTQFLSICSCVLNKNKYKM